MKWAHIFAQRQPYKSCNENLIVNFIACDISGKSFSILTIYEIETYYNYGYDKRTSFLKSNYEYFNNKYGMFLKIVELYQKFPPGLNNPVFILYLKQTSYKEYFPEKWFLEYPNLFTEYHPPTDDYLNMKKELIEKYHF